MVEKTNTVVAKAIGVGNNSKRYAEILSVVSVLRVVPSVASAGTQRTISENGCFQMRTRSKRWA